MRNFKSYITELFDRKVPVRNSSTGDTSWAYRFILMENGGRLVVAPEGKELEAWVNDKLRESGIPEPKRIPTEELSGIVKKAFNPATLKVMAYTVGFFNIKFEKAYNELELMSDGDIRKGVWELDFSMREAELSVHTRGRIGITGRYYWEWDAGTDDDINQFSGADAAMILGAVTDAAKDFVRQKKPRGLIFGTKETANPARGRIYKAIAKQAASKTGGKVIEVGAARDGMANGVMVWFDRKNPFRVVGFPDSPYEQKA